MTVIVVVCWFNWVSVDVIVLVVTIVIWFVIGTVFTLKVSSTSQVTIESIWIEWFPFWAMLFVANLFYICYTVWTYPIGVNLYHTISLWV